MPAAEQDRTRVLNAATGPPANEWNRPDVVERHVAKKRVATQIQFLEVGRLRAHPQRPVLPVSDRRRWRSIGPPALMIPVVAPADLIDPRRSGAPLCSALDPAQ